MTAKKKASAKAQLSSPVKSAVYSRLAKAVSSDNAAERVRSLAYKSGDRRTKEFNKVVKEARVARDERKEAAKPASILRSKAAAVSGTHRAGLQHSLQKGKRGGTFYLSEGKKVYAKKTP